MRETARSSGVGAPPRPAGQRAEHIGDFAAVRRPGPQLFPHRRLNVREPVQIDGRSFGGEGVGGKARWLGLTEVVIGPLHERGQVRRAVRIVGRFRLAAPLPVAREQLVLGASADAVAGGIGAVAAKHQRNARLAAGLVGGLRCFRDQFAVKNGRRLVRWRVRSWLGRSASQDFVGAESSQLGQRGWSVPSIPIDFANVMPIVSADTG